MAITLYFANPGAGKTTLAARIVQKEYKKLKKGKSKYKNIYCNANIKNSIFLDIPKILKSQAFENSLLIIDEASIEYNNRLMKMKPLEIQFFKLHRHYKCDIILISQSYEDVDITLRRMYSKMYMLKNLGFHITMVREVKKYMTIDDNEQFIEGYKFAKIPRFFYRKKWYKFFDSYWIPDNVSIYNNEREKEKIFKIV